MSRHLADDINVVLDHERDSGEGKLLNDSTIGHVPLPVLGRRNNTLIYLAAQYLHFRRKRWSQILGEQRYSHRLNPYLNLNCYLSFSAGLFLE